MGRERLRAVGRMIRQAETVGGQRTITGTITQDATGGGWAQVDIGDQVIPAAVPGTIRILTAGQEVRLSVQGTLHTVEAVSSALPTPSVVEGPGQADENPWAAPATLTGAGYSNSGFTTQDMQNGLYTEYVRGFVVDHSWWIGDLYERLNALTEKVDQIAAALKEQGSIS